MAADTLGEGTMDAAATGHGGVTADEAVDHPSAVLAVVLEVADFTVEEEVSTGAEEAMVEVVDTGRLEPYGGCTRRRRA
jgi:hypothetical protein